HHVVNGTDTIGVVRVFDWVKFDQGVPVNEVIQPLRAATEARHHLAGIERFAFPIDTATLNEIHHPVGEQFRVDAQPLPSADAFRHRGWHRPATDLQAVTVPDEGRHVGAELALDVCDDRARIFRQWMVRFKHRVHAGKRYTGRTVRLWHAVVDLRDDRARYQAGLLHKA